jgi:hypothetical protein
VSLDWGRIQVVQVGLVMQDESENVFYVLACVQFYLVLAEKGELVSAEHLDLQWHALPSHGNQTEMEFRVGQQKGDLLEA